MRRGPKGNVVEQIPAPILGQLGHQRAVQPMQALAGMAGLTIAYRRDIDFAVHAHAVVCELDFREYVPDVARVLYLQIDLAVQSAIGHIVDHIAERRNVQIFPAVQAHGQQIVLLGEFTGQVHGKGRVAAAMLPKQLAIEIDLGLVGSTKESQP